MKKFRAFLVAILMAASSLFVVANDVTPVAATAGNCSRGGQYYVNGTYAMINCFYGVPGDAVRITITCKYNLAGVAHTYNVYGGWAYWAYNNPQTSYPGAPGSTGWSTASCGHHVQSGPNNNDWIIHACPQLNNGSGAWGSAFCF